MPIFVLLSVWLMGTFLFSVVPGLYALDCWTIVRILIYLFVATSGYLCGKFLLPKVNLGSECLPNIKLLKSVSSIVFIILMVKVVFVVHALISSGNISDYFYYKRVDALSGGLKSQFVWGQFLAFCFVYLILDCCYSLQYRGRLSPLTIISLGAYLVVVTAEGGRSVAVLFLICVFFVAVLSGKFGKFKIVSLSGLIVALFLLSAYFMRITNTQKESENIVNVLMDQFVVYVFGGVKGYDAFLHYKTAVFSPIFNAIFLNHKPFQMTFVDIGTNISTNVYSAFSVYEYYLGYIPSCFFVYILFALVAFVFNLKGKRSLTLGLRCLLLTCIFLTIFFDYFSAILPYVVRYVVLYLLLNRLFRLLFNLHNNYNVS